MAQFFTFTPKRKEDGAIDFYTLMDVFDEPLPGMGSEK